MRTKDRFKTIFNMIRTFMNGLRESGRSMGIKVDDFKYSKWPDMFGDYEKVDGPKFWLQRAKSRQSFQLFCGPPTFIRPDLSFSNSYEMTIYFDP